MPIYLCQPGSSSKEPWRHGVQVYERPFPLHDDEGEQDNHQKQQRSSSSSGASGSGGGPRQIVVMLSSPSEKMPTLRRYITEYCTSPTSDRILIFCNGSYGGEGGTNGTSALAIARSLIRGEGGEEGGGGKAAHRAGGRTKFDLALAGEHGFEALTNAPSASPGSALASPGNPNEPRYCVCRSVSDGKMIGCDNDDCAIEWFHFACVGLNPNAEVKGKWICPPCRGKKR